ncbi:MAG TPA: FAD-dependent monooxygenase, partial [Pseudoxanthomonas sp.]|nr:FAD-dependent monooxygenase [Pseudoxanthomonas sp.]
MSERHDVLIIGGGLVGASLAIALDGLGLDVALVEATPAGEMPAVFDQRNLSFSAATVNALGALGVMDALQAPTGPIRRIHVSRQGDFGSVRLDARDYGRETFGEVAVARDFGAALEKRLQSLDRLVRHRPARFVGFDGGAEGEVRSVRVLDDGGERILRTRLLVAADGSHGAVRDALGIGSSHHDYRQTLMVARVRTAQAPDGIAYERFTRDGPTALLPRGDRHFGAVHAVPQAQAEAVAALDERAWLERLQQAFGWRAGRFLHSGPRSAYPVFQRVAERTVAPRAVLLGNAAQTLHP